MRLSALVTASAILTLTVSPVFAQGVMVRRPAAAPQTQEAARAESRPESSAAVETKAQEPKAQDPREDIRKIVREELRAALREMRAAEARAAEKQPETAPAKPAPAPEAVAVKPAEPVPATRPMRMRAMQQQQDPAAPKPAPKTEPAKKSQDEVIAELEAELRGIQAEIERSMAAETKPAAKAPAEKQQEPATKPKAREPKAVAVQPSQPAEAKEPVAPRTFSGEVAEGQPRRIMVLRTEETSGEPMVIEMAPEESGRRIERGLRMQAEQDGIRTYRSETRAEQPPGDDRGGCNCDCQCCQQHRGPGPAARAPRPAGASPAGSYKLARRRRDAGRQGPAAGTEGHAHAPHGTDADGPRDPQAGDGPPARPDRGRPAPPARHGRVGTRPGSRPGPRRARQERGVPPRPRRLIASS